MSNETIGTDWAHVLNDRLRADITAAMRTRWNAALDSRFAHPPLTEREKEGAALRVADFLSSDTGKFRRKPTLQDMEEQITWTRNRSGSPNGGHVETLEDAVSSIMQDACPHMRFSRAMAPSRFKFRMQILEALNRSGKPAERDVRKHPRFMMRPADAHVRAALDDLRANPPGGRIDEDEYLYAVERLLSGARMEAIPRPVNDPFARVVNFAAAGMARPDEQRAINNEGEEWL